MADDCSATARLPAVVARDERTVERSSWKKLAKVAGQIPFAEELAAAYFCAVDPVTPPRVRGVLIAALAYFVVPADAIPEFVAGLGFTDDAAVLAIAIGLVSNYITPLHHARARAALDLPEPPAES